MTTIITFYLLGVITGWVLLKRTEWVTTFFNWVKSLFA